jgi:hypothetical protein
MSSFLEEYYPLPLDVAIDGNTDIFFLPAERTYTAQRKSIKEVLSPAV